MTKHLEVGSEEHNDDIKRRAEKRFERIDNLSPEVRAVVHEYGWNAVQELMHLGVKTAPRLLHIIRACRNGR